MGVTEELSLRVVFYRGKDWWDRGLTRLKQLGFISEPTYGGNNSPDMWGAAGGFG